MDTGSLTLGLVCGAVLGAALARLRPRRAKAKVATSQNEARLRAMFDASPAFIWLKDTENRMLLVNQRAAAGLGRTTQEMEGRPTGEFYPDLAGRYYADDLEVVTSRRAKVGIIEPLLAADGTSTWVRTDKVPMIGDGGKALAVMVFAFDVTNLKRAELRLAEALQEAERASRAKSDFLSVVSHEIRTPLGVILGFSEILMTTPQLSPAHVAHAEKIQRNGKRLQKLIDDILDVARIEQGKILVEATPFSPRQLMLDLEPQFRALAQQRSLELGLRIDPKTPGEIVSDPNRFRQIVTNLVENAIKFTESGRIDIDMAPRAGVAALEVRVKDTGRGVEDRARARLFQPFTQIDPTATMAGGVGLGLSLTKKLAEALGGDVVLAESSLGKGSTFIVWIATNLTTLSESAHPAAGDAKPEGASLLVGKKVLLVEDHDDIREMVIRYLETTGATILSADNGRSGVELALSAQPDFVLMDLSMPSLDGMAATAILRERGCTMPIIAITANAMKGQLDACLAGGFDDFITKPLTREDLIARLLRSLRRTTTG